MPDRQDRGVRDLGPHVPHVSIVVPFADDEDRVGAACARLLQHFADRGLVAELIAVDEGSGDNSKALLAMLATHVPALRVLHARAGRGYADGARVARGRLLLAVELREVDATIAGQGWALGRLDDPRLDLALVPGRFALVRRTRAVRALDRTVGRGHAYHRRLARAARSAGLGVTVPAASTGVRWFAPLRGLAAAGFGLLGR